MPTPRSIPLLLTLGTAVTAWLPLSAQQRDRALPHLYHTAWTTRDGAPGDVQALAQTADGFLWLGTLSGLFRFDGVRFELYEPPPPDTLPSVGVSALLALADGGLWVGYQFGGVSLIREGSIRSFGEGDGLQRGTVMNLVRDSSGAIWSGGTGGVARMENGRWHTLGPKEGLSGAPVTGMMVDRGGRIWVAADDGMFARPAGAPRFERVGPPRSSNVGFRDRNVMQEAPDGTIWSVSREFGLRRLGAPAAAPGAGAAIPSISDPGLMLIERNGTFWFNHVQTPDIERFPADGRTSQRMRQGLSGGTVQAWLEDREGNVWAGTSNGLDHFRRTKLTRVELPAPGTYFAIAPADSGAVWVGSNEGPVRRVGARIEEFPELPRLVDVVYRDPDGAVWIGSPEGLWRSAGGTFERVRLPDVKNIGIQAVTRDGAGDLWISIVRSGVYRKVGDRWEAFGGRDDLPREPAVVLTTDGSGRTWLGYTGNRVARLEGDSLRLYTSKDGLNVGIVLAIHVQGPRVWVGGERGVALLTRDRVQTVTGRNGVQFRGTSGIVETPAGEVWLHGAIGITRIPADEVRRADNDPRYQVNHERLDYRDGLTGTAAQIRPQPTVVAGTDGRLWFATTLGVAWLDPDSVPRNPTAPPVAIRRVAAGARSYQPDPDLRLPVRTTSLRIDYTALSLSIPDRVRFRYRLVGSDTGWQEAGGRREAFYTNLGPGAYRFHVIAANEDGIWNAEGATIDFTIPPSITQTRWFLLVWIAAIGVLIWVAYLARVRQVAAGMRVRYQAGLAERARIAHELHDTLLQGFTGITLQLRAIERLLAHRPAEGVEALKNVLATADTTLRHARHMIWDLRAVELEGHDLAGALETATRSAVAGSGVELVFAVRGNARRLPVALETTALRIGRESVLNAVKHAAPSLVHVAVEYGPRALTVRIRDDGAGMSPTAMGTLTAGEHMGIAGMRDRAQSVGGTLEIASTPGAGTIVSLVLPFRPSGRHREAASGGKETQLTEGKALG
ncbi:MAG TPA: two-component regulator propeller domain-containing protein [Gemmatimonadales bacterium]|nr:two-component regulator propeller domain-containing protein [Gemmatimonadales bacterium]